MPAEKIRTEAEVFYDGVTPSRPFEVSVGWFKGPVHTSRGIKDGGVQLSVLNTEQPPEDQGYTTQLTRKEINRLIRALRKARDAAYGSDA